MRTSVLALCLAPLLVAGCAAQPKALAPVAAPVIAKPGPVPVSLLAAQVNIPNETFTLANGLRVIVHEDRKAPIVAVSVWYHIGSRNEPAGKTGFAHLFEHLMFNGSENAPGDYFEPLQEVGATDFNGTTWFDRTNYFQNVPTAALERALFLESDRMGHLLGAVTQAKLDNQRGVVQNEKRQGDNQPFGMVEYAQLEALFPAGHPYHHATIGSMADLDAASLEDVKNWFRAHYGPNNAVLVLAGDIDAKTAKPLVEKWFGDIARGPEPVADSVDIPTLATPKTEVLKDRVATTRIYRNWVVPGVDSADAVPLDIAASVLGGLSSSRLDNALVRKEQIAVSVTASLQAFEKVSLFEVTADVKPGVDPALVAKRLDEIIADFRANGPTADEVQRVATGELASSIVGLEQVGGFNGKANVLAEGLLYNNDVNHYRAELAQYGSATPAQVTAVMQKWLSRPVYNLTVEPGQRGAYEEAKTSNAKIAPRQYWSGEGAAPDNVAPIAKADRSKLPQVTPVADLDFPTVERATLSNGVTIRYVQRQSTPTTRLSLSFDAGYAADNRDKLGTQALMLSLLDEGTTSRNSIQIAEEQERLGASISAGASMDRTSLSLFALTPNLDLSLDLFEDIVKHPAFAPDEVERLRAQQLAGIAAEAKEPNAIASRALPPLLYGKDNPYGIPFSGSGTEASVKSVTRDDLIAFHQSWLRPEKLSIFVVSDLPLAELQPKLEARFGAWQGTGVAAPAKPINATVAAPKTSRIILINRPDSPQSVILAGQVLPLNGTDELLPLQTGIEVLSNNFLSRLNMDLRETKGWSYGVRGGVTQFEGQVPYIITAPVQADKTGPAIAEILSQVMAFRTTKGITADEFRRRISDNILKLPGSFETAGAVLTAMQRNALFQRPDDFYDGLASRYRGMTAGELDKAVRAVIDPARFTWVIVGDAAKVGPQLRTLKIPVENVEAPE
ncbi:M16 family metallopeptidase [Aquisediminimonas sediminicola]|uniref:M16 family metallopeptidase n=1 Tax=Alteraquisediminimonas sediminicola TaxID=2676787 RepID=UPI001C8D2126|nr:pitrilysin family protein [Aquisediminimonas sediminicola]